MPVLPRTKAFGAAPKRTVEAVPLRSPLKGLMDKFVIRGGNPLLGTIRVSGAKNAALPAMAAALLTDDTVVLENIPDVRDIETTRKLLVAMGAEVELGYGRASHRTTISCKNLSTTPEASYRSEEHTSELQSLRHLVCRLLL